ncbi:hypothetical protein C5167_049221 [Papaver somniferum]|uniref:Uncharacterized protein n=1 Tax=Papaver somniferum TaxID=3469 RepID=A0A4Y7KNI6_PAPSO|nr:hypothetical protein C5167_049221 [Papaver somniferum]
MAEHINCSTTKYIMSYLKKQSPGRALLTGITSNESNNNSSMTTIRRDQAIHSTYERRHWMSIAMICEKKMKSEIQAGETLTTLAEITQFADDWCCINCPECSQDFEEIRHEKQCLKCLKYISLTQYQPIFQAKGIVAKELLGHTDDYLMQMKAVMHRQIVFQVKIGIYGGNNRDKNFEFTKAFVKRNYAEYFVEDLMAGVRIYTIPSIT